MRVGLQDLSILFVTTVGIVLVYGIWLWIAWKFYQVITRSARELGEIKAAIQQGSARPV